MSNFWDSIMFPTKTEPVVAVEKTDFWASIGMGTKPVKQSKAKTVKNTVKQSKAVEQAEQVYETVEGLVVPTEGCTHHFMIPTEGKWVIGTCKKCNGERWFNNRNAEQSNFNDTLVSPTEQSISNEIAKGDLEQSRDIQDITTAYKAEQNSISEGE